MCASCYVGEGLVDGDALDGRREIAQHSDGGVTEALVVIEMSGDEDEVGTEWPRASSGHTAPYPEGPRFVRGRENDTAADRNRLAPQARVKQLFDRRVEGVEVRVENRGCGDHLVDSSPWPSLDDATHHTHHSADASRASSSADPTPRRSATGAPAAIKR